MMQIGASLLLGLGLLVGNHASASDWTNNARNRMVTVVLKNEVLQESLLRQMLGDRCRRLIRPYAISNFTGLTVGSACAAGVKQFMAALDSSVVSFTNPITELPDRATATFVKDLQVLIKDSRAQQLLAYLREKSERSGNDPIEIQNLFSQMLRSERLAQRWVGVLFQDTSSVMVHVSWLKGLHSEMSFEEKEAVGNLESIIRAFNKDHRHRHFGFLPNYAELSGFARWNGKSYHLTVPAVVSQKMLANGSRAEMAFLMPFLFNYLYEAAEDGLPMLRLVSEPRHMQGKDSIRDVYLGYLGAFSAVYPDRKAISHRELEKDFLQRPSQALRRVVHHGMGYRLDPAP